MVFNNGSLIEYMLDKQMLLIKDICDTTFHVVEESLPPSLRLVKKSSICYNVNRLSKSCPDWLQARVSLWGGLVDRGRRVIQIIYKNTAKLFQWLSQSRLNLGSIEQNCTYNQLIQTFKERNDGRCCPS